MHTATAPRARGDHEMRDYRLPSEFTGGRFFVPVLAGRDGSGVER